MHRQTIASYDLGAEHWVRSRYRSSDGVEPALATAEAFRHRVGDGLILDIGSGPGRLLAALGTPAIGLDASLAMLAFGRSEGAGPFVASDAEALPVATGAIAGCFAHFSLQHLPRAGFVVAVREMHRVLRPPGLLHIAMHLRNDDDGVRVHDDMPLGRWFTYWEPAELAKELKNAGFAILRAEDAGFAQRVTAQRQP